MLYCREIYRSEAFMSLEKQLKGIASKLVIYVSMYLQSLLEQ